MSEGQQQRRHDNGDAVKNGDDFNVSGDLPSKPITPLDPATMKAEEDTEESIGGQVLGRFVELYVPANTQGEAFDPDSVTIGEALEATALSAGDKPVEQSDAAAIQAAEERATGGTIPGVLAAAAQSAATLNARISTDECKTTLSDVLADASLKLRADKTVSPEDVEIVICAEVSNDPEMSSASGGVAASMAAAARLNENMSI